MAEHNLV